MSGHWAIAGGITITVVGGLALWYSKSQLSAILTSADINPAKTPTESDLAEVRDMAEQAMAKASDAQATAELARQSIDDLTHQLVEATNQADEPLLVRIQTRLETIEEELQRQSRVETERAVNMGRIAAILENMDGVDADDVDLEELAEQLPETSPLSDYGRDN